MKYTLDFKNKTVTDGEILIPINEEVLISEALGDRLGIQSSTQSKGLKNELWIMRDYTDADDTDVIEFLKEHITTSQYRAVLGFIERLA